MRNSRPDRGERAQQARELAAATAKWRNLPTVAIRVPEAFRDRLLSTARSWDAGESVSDAEVEPQCSGAIGGMVELRPSASLEDCLIALARQYGGARKIAQSALERCDSGDLRALKLWIEVLLDEPEPPAKDTAIVALERCEDREKSEIMEAIASELEAPWLEWVIGQLQQRLDAEREAAMDRRIERAIGHLAMNCDGAAERDERGFNGCDAKYGRKLAQSAGNWTAAQARSALAMLQKYRKTQLEPAGYELPESWEAIAHQYGAGEISDYRIVLEGSKIVFYCPSDRSERDRWAAPAITPTVKAIEPRPAFNGATKGWEFSPAAGAELVRIFGDQFEISADVFEAIARHEERAAELEVERAAEQRRAAERSAAEKVEQEAAKEAAAQQGAIELQELIEVADLDTPLPSGRVLFAHQKEAAIWLLGQTYKGYSGGVLADQMGLGKTTSALVAARAIVRKFEIPVFVICPASLKENWLREAEGVGVGIEVFSWAKLPEPLEYGKYLMIWDEAHYAQGGGKTQRGKKFLELSRHANCHASWSLTGTPMKNGAPINLFPLLQSARHELTRSKDADWTYFRKFCNAHQKTIGRGKSVWDFSGAAHLGELAKATESVILRRTKKECLDLPAKIRALKPVELESKLEKQYQTRISEAVRDYRDRAKKGEVDGDAEALVTLGILRKIGSEYKAEATIELAREILEQGEQVVVFTEYLESAQTIHAELGGELLTGATPSDQRQGIVDRFQSGEAKVFVGTIRAGGVGLTLTAASNVILHDRPWTPGDSEQAEDRCHRIGQDSTVTAFWMQLGAIDVAIDQLLEQKSERIELVLKGKRKTLRGVGSINDLAKELLANL